jgi:hypothetical protein
MKHIVLLSASSDQGLRVRRSHLRAGKPLINFSDYSRDFFENILDFCPTESLSQALNHTNESCKKVNNNWKACDAWGAKFPNIPFGRG